jgi:hypothetical protein
LEYLPVDEVVVLEDWKLVARWGSDIANKVRDWGFAAIK